MTEAGEAPIIRRMATIKNKRGLHARAAAKLVKLASSFSAEVRVVKNGSVVNGRSIMGLMMLSAATGSVIEIRAWGADDAGAAADAVAQLVADGFHEED